MNSLSALLASTVEALHTYVPLTALCPATKIGMGVRKKLEYPCIEITLDGGTNERDIKEVQTIGISVYGTTSLADTVAISDQVKEALTSKRITDAVPASGVRIAKVSLTRNTILPQDEYGHRVEQSFDMRYVQAK